MKKNFFNKKNILFMIFFLLTIGNGKFIADKFGNKIELLSLVLLIVASIFSSKKNIESVKEDIKIIIFSIALSYGAFYNNVSKEVLMMIFLSSLLLMSYPKFARLFVFENSQVKVIGDALLFGMIVNCIMGIATGTLGLSFNSSAAIIRVLLPCGFKIKNYCGGVWLVIFLSYYIYYFRENDIRKHRFKFFLIFFFLLLSGSKGACFLTLAFLFSINFKKILKFKANQGKLFYTFLIILVIALLIYAYNHILINIPTYAYRIRGLNKLFNLFMRDSSKLMFGISNIAYADTGFDYTINMRNFLGWEASIEMAYVNIFIKNGFIGFLIYIKIFKDIINRSKKISKKEKDIVICLLIVMILSGFIETYIASIHYVVGPAMFCLINSVIYNYKIKEEKWLN